MYKFLAIAAVIVLIGAGSAMAAGGCGGCQSHCDDTGVSAPAATAQVPAGTQARRSYSYEPSMRGYRSYSNRGMRGYSAGPSYLDATAKSRGK